MKIFYLAIVLTFISCKDSQKKQAIVFCDSSNFHQPVERVSFDDIDHIKTLNGKFIEIEGFFYANFEDVALYPSRSSHSTAKALWLNLTLPDSSLYKADKKKVAVIGRVNIFQKGHLNGYLATLDSAFCIMEVNRGLPQ